MDLMQLAINIANELFVGSIIPHVHAPEGQKTRTTRYYASKIHGDPLNEFVNRKPQMFIVRLSAILIIRQL